MTQTIDAIRTVKVLPRHRRRPVHEDYDSFLQSFFETEERRDQSLSSLLIEVSKIRNTVEGITEGISQATADARYLNEASNLSDLDSALTARDNLGVRDASDISLLSTEIGIVASASSTQAGATQLTKEVNQIGTVVTIGDSVKLPAAATGLRVYVMNDGANSADVFPLLGDEIESLGVDIADALAAAGRVTYIGISATLWRKF